MRNNLIVAAAVAALSLPLAALAAGDKKPDTAAGTGSTAGATASRASDGGAEAMFKSLDKNNDGSLTKEETAGTPHEKDFTRLDTNKDGKLSRAEHAAAPEHTAAAGRSGTMGSGSTTSPSSAPSGTSGTKGSKY
jgi:hypothetical protein